MTSPVSRFTTTLCVTFGLNLTASVSGPAERTWSQPLPPPSIAAAYGVRLTLTPMPGEVTTIATVDGQLHLDGFVLSVSQASHTLARALVAV